MIGNFDIVKYITEQKFGGFGDNFKYDEMGVSSYDSDYASKYYIMEADPEWDRVDYDAADLMIRGEFWQEGGSRLYDSICKLLDNGMDPITVKRRAQRAASAIEKRVKDPKADGNLRAGVGSLLDSYIKNAQQRHHR
jgi:hypothetical protein